MSNKVQPKILTGFMELLPEDQILFNKMYDTIRKVYERFGFLPLDTPVIEYSEVLLAKAGGETEKQIYRFNKGENDLSLRFDLTVPLARYVAQRYSDLVFPFKRYQMSKVFRGERPQKGRFREFYQCDIDIIGNEELELIYDAEMPTVIYTIFKELNIGEFTIRINNRKVLNGFFSALDLAEKAADILRVIDKIDKIGKEAVEEELQKLEISVEKVGKIIEFVQIKGSNEEVIVKLRNNGISDESYINGVNELEAVVNYIKQFGVSSDNYTIDLTIARGLDYYTGTVYETTLNEYPHLGSICSGGRYDNLTGYYTNQSLPGIGISIGLTRLFSQLKEQNIISSEQKSLVKVLIAPFDNNNMEYVLFVAKKFREADIVTDVCYINKAIKHKMKYANRLNIPYVAVIGEDEIKNNMITLKDMKAGIQETISVEQAIEKII